MSYWLAYLTLVVWDLIWEGKGNIQCAVLLYRLYKDLLHDFILGQWMSWEGGHWSILVGDAGEFFNNPFSQLVQGFFGRKVNACTIQDCQS